MHRRALGRKGLFVALAALALAGAGGSGLAGQKQEQNVAIMIESVTSWATGSVGTARDSRDSNQMIQCQIQGSTTSNIVSCAARNEVGTYLSCTASGSTTYMAAVVAGIGPNSRITFYVDSFGKCTQINAINGSTYKPVVP